MPAPTTNFARQPYSVRTFSLDYEFLCAISIYLINSALMIWFFDPWIQGWADSVRGFNQFNALLFDREPVLNESNQISLRFCMAIITFNMIILLIALNLISRSAAIFFLILPSAAYFSTKIKIEFILFPLCAIRTDLEWKKEILVLAGILLLSNAIGENNGYIILFFRIMARTFSAWRVPSWLFLVSLAVIIVVLDYYFSLLYPFYPELKRFEWTRDIINPDYSIFETIAVFLSSMVFSVNPQTDFPIGLIATAIVLLAIFPAKNGSINVGALKEIWGNPNVRALILTVILFTSATHAFQNARYYYFYVIVFAMVSGRRGRQIVMAISIPTTVAMMLYYLLVVDLDTFL